ncbi:MAG: type II CAAX endopeptidase family protein [Bacteroidota bacterium]
MQNNEQERHSWIKLILLFSYIFLLGLVTVIGGSDDIEMNMDNPNTIVLLKVLQAVSVLMVFILPALVFALFWTKTKIHYLGVTKRSAFATLLIAGIGMILAMPLINWLSEVNQHMNLPQMFSGIELWMQQSEEKAKVLTETFTKGTSVGVLLLNLFVIAFMAAISEELFFRGVLQKVAIEATRNKHIGVWISAIIFSAFHMQFYGFFPRMLMGAYLGYLFLWSGSLWPGIVAHFINNGTAVFLIWLTNRGEVTEGADKVGMHEGEWLYTLVSAVMVGMSLFLVYRIEKKRMQLQP